MIVRKVVSARPSRIDFITPVLLVSEGLGGGKNALEEILEGEKIRLH